MPDIAAGYIRLFDLAGYWAHAGGIPHQMAFRRLCEWAACDAFPPGALVDRFERPIQPRDIYFDLETAMSGQWHAQNRPDGDHRAGQRPAGFLRAYQHDPAAAAA
jgi:hypothetical protein